MQEDERKVVHATIWVAAQKDEDLDCAQMGFEFGRLSHDDCITLATEDGNDVVDQMNEEEEVEEDKMEHFTEGTFLGMHEVTEWWIALDPEILAEKLRELGYEVTKPE